MFWVSPCFFFRSDYVPYEVTRRPEKPQAEYKPKPGQIDLGTTYKQDFNQYEVQPFVASRPKERAHTINAKLDTVPTYKGNDIMFIVKPCYIC